MKRRINSHLEPKASQITPKQVYLRRRDIIKLGGVGLSSGLLPAMNARAGDKIYKDVLKSDFSTTDDLTRYEDASKYNNFYEFGTGKDDPAENAHSLKPSPWSVTVEGECNKPGVYDLEDLLKNVQLEERIYRLRCVEAWSMVIPWVGFELGSLLKRFEPTGNAKFIEFETLLDKSQMPGQNRRVLNWPYREGLRMDEAMHPLTLLAVGMYGETLPNQNGAPLRLVVPWKYGFKSIKSIVKIRFREDQPVSSWTQSAPREYGFYSNVNPKKSHPRWSQSSERRISGERSLLSSIFQDRVDTQMFNGYEEQVAGLYSGMDLDKNF